MENQGAQDKSFKEDILKPTLKFGSIGGAFGLVYGTVTGTLRSKTPVLFATASGIQCFCLSATYWNARSSFLHSKLFHPPSSNEPTASTYLKASSAAGCVTGSAMGLLFRGPRNVIPGAIMFTIFGYGGQRAYDFLDQRHTRQVVHEQETASSGERDMSQSLWRRFVGWLSDPNKSWSPIKKLSDQDYENMLQEKLIGVEADLAMIDEEIAKVRREGGKEKR